MKLHARPRQAFTLLELLVVLGIIALLASITVSAVFRLQSGQKESNTNTHLTKIQMAFDQQWKPAGEQFRKEAIPDALRAYTIDNTGNPDSARARALHVKLKIRQAFPQTYREARLLLTDFANDTKLYAAYGPRQSIVNAIGAGNGPNTDIESAVLLYLILSQSRGGAAQNVEQIARTDLIDVGGKQQRVFVDEWSNPICFRRWATDAELTSATAPLLTELNSPPFVASATTLNKDPDDPDGRLKANSSWKPQAQQIVRQWFTIPLNNVVADPFDGNNRGPFILSAGKDAQISPPNDADNLYGFRLQQFRKGN